MVVARFEAVGGREYAADWLTPAERARHDRLRREDDRAAYLAAHVLARECVGALLGSAPDRITLAQRCADCGREGHGPPTVVGHPDVRVSLSHAREYVAAVAAHAVCGIDVETVREGPARALTAAEAGWLAGSADRAAAYTTLWVRKEALVKAGAGSLGSLGLLDVRDLGASLDWELGEWAAAGARGAWVVRR